MIYCCTGCLGTALERSCAVEIEPNTIKPKRCIITGIKVEWIKDVTRDCFEEE